MATGEDLLSQEEMVSPKNTHPWFMVRSRPKQLIALAWKESWLSISNFLFIAKQIVFQDDMGLDTEQVNVLKRCFDGFADEDGAIPAENVGNILSLMGLKVKPMALKEIIEEIDEDGNDRKAFEIS